jgi:hypothetical protein
MKINKFNFSFFDTVDCMKYEGYTLLEILTSDTISSDTS